MSVIHGAGDYRPCLATLPARKDRSNAVNPVIPVIPVIPGAPVTLIRWKP